MRSIYCEITNRSRTEQTIPIQKIICINGGLLDSTEVEVDKVRSANKITTIIFYIIRILSSYPNMKCQIVSNFLSELSLNIAIGCENLDGNRIFGIQQLNNEQFRLGGLVNLLAFSEMKDNFEDLSPWEGEQTEQKAVEKKLKPLNKHPFVRSRRQFEVRNIFHDRPIQSKSIHYRSVESRQISLKNLKVIHQPGLRTIKSSSKPLFKKAVIQPQQSSILQPRMSTPYACRRIQSIIQNKLQKRGKGQRMAKINSYKDEEKTNPGYQNAIIAHKKIKDICFENNTEHQTYHQQLARLVEQKKKKMIVSVQKKHFLDRIFGQSRLD